MPKHSYLMLNHFQIPSILKVGAKRYFGQSALGGPFHVTLWVYFCWMKSVWLTSIHLHWISLCFCGRISYACLVVILCVMRTTGMAGELVPMAWGLVLGWSNVMYFTRGFEMLGPYVIVIQKVEHFAEAASHCCWFVDPA